jgi:hypothetical protein
MRRLVLPILAALCLVVWAAAFVLIRAQPNSDLTIIPTVMMLPSLTPTDTPAPTATPSLTATLTATATTAPTDTPVPTFLPTLSEHVLEIALVMPGVYIPPTLTPFPPGTILLPAPPNPVEPLPDATYEPPPYDGWYSFESDHPLVRYATRWEPRLRPQASRGQYHRTEDVHSFVSFRFDGEGLRLRYIAAPNMGVFDILVDGTVIDSVDAYAPEIAFPGTRVYFVGQGQHTLEIRSAGRKHPASSGYVLALDAVQVWQGSPNTLILPPPAETATPTATPQAAEVALIAAPPTLAATSTDVPPRSIRASVIIAYDENGNRTVDPAEGVAGISVRVVEADTNRVIASSFTDTRGYATFELVLDVPLQLVVPYFGAAWAIARGDAVAHTLLLTPGNQPGLIP